MKKLTLISLILFLLGTSPYSSTAQKALALSWTGYAESSTNFNNFLKSNHTVAFRFMPQFPNAYQGPVLAENGSGNYFIGMGDFWEAGGESSLLVSIGSQKTIIKHTFNAGNWYHVVLTCKENGNNLDFTIYIDGNNKGAFSVAKNDNSLPVGNIRFGKRTTGQTVGGKNAQFYGLVDDVAIFTRELSTDDIAKLVSNKDIAGFSTLSPMATYHFNTNATTHGAASLVSILSNKINDAGSLPLPTAQKLMSLPVPKGQAWYVIQGCDEKGGSHKGYASFCWDLMVDGQPQGDDYPNGTGGAPARAAASGKVITVNQSKASGESPSNIIEIQQGPNEVCAYLHIRKNSSKVNINDHPLYNQELAKTGDVGAAVSANHIHIAVTDKPDGTPGFVTFPVAFTNYEVRQPNGSWKFVERGMPKGGEVVRTPPADDLPYKMVAVWKPAGNEAELQAYGVTHEKLKEKYDNLWAKGYRLSSIKAHPFNGQLRYTAVWKKSTDAEIQVYGWSYEDYRKKYDELWGQGWRLKLLDVCMYNGKPHYTAVWKKSTEGEIQVYGWSYEDLRKKYDELWNQGWRLKLINAYATNGGVRYTAAWAPGTAGEIQVYSWPYEDFRKKYDELWAKGMRLSMLSNCIVNGKTLYTAVWRNDTKGEYQAYEWNYKEYREFYDNIWNDGWRLSIINVL